MDDVKIESDVKYDDRRKEMTHITKEIRKAQIDEEEIGEVSIESKGVYNESGIKRIIKDLKSKKKQLESAVGLQEKKELKEVPEITEDLKEIKEKLIKLQEIDKIEKENIQIESHNNQFEDDKKNLDQVKKDLRNITETIGSRLKL